MADRGGSWKRGRGNTQGWRGRGSWRGNRGWRRGGGWRGRENWRGGGGRGGRLQWSSQQGGEGSQVTGGVSQPQITTMLPPVPTPYKGWHLYMNEGYSEGSETVTFVTAFESYLRRLHPTLKREEVVKRQSFLADIKMLLKDDLVKEAIPEIHNLIVSDPARIINCLGLAMHQLLTEESEAELKDAAAEVLPEGGESLQKVVQEINYPRIHARLSNHVRLTELKNIKASYYGKLVSVKGTVVRVSSTKCLCATLAFTCMGCGVVQGVAQLEGRYTMATSCPTQHCRSRSFELQRCHKLTQTVDWQTFKIQEIIGDKQKGGCVPRTIECEVQEDLVDSCVPGDMVTVTGIVKVSQSQEGRGSKGDKCMFSLYIDASSVTSCKEGNDPASAVGIEFSLKDYYAIQKIQAEPNLFRLLCASLCPSIYGHQLVKAGLMLCLFGGCTKEIGDGVVVRGDPHILVVGDPGLGKSQMLQACAHVAPRGVYVCGNTTTTSGLTITLVREGHSGDYALEGGALVLSDQGACCIDEFDKMTNQHQALLEAMEQQCISIAKAGIVSSLPARTSILAAANPVGGHYNKAKTVSENLKMKSALLSRFDLVFILLDKPDEELDCLLSEHVVALHSGCGDKMGSTGARRVKRDEFYPLPNNPEDHLLRDRLKYSPDELFDPVPHQLIRKYICYARKYVRPKLTPGAAKVLQHFYLDLRVRHQSTNSTPVTTRQLESLIRLTEARARCELREEATEEDARDVVEVMRYSMLDTFSDEFSLLDFQRSQLGSGSSNKAQMKKFIGALQQLSENTCKSIFRVDEMLQLARQSSIQVRDFGDFLATLNHQGYLIKKGPKIYQLLTADC